jgi:hypothetical protein
VSALFIITVVFIAAIAYTIYRKQRQLAVTYPELPPPPPRGLFGGRAADGRQALPAQVADVQGAATEREALLARATAGDLDALGDAATLRNGVHFAATLEALLKWAESSDEKVRAIGAFVATDGRVASAERSHGSAGLSRAYSALWEREPDAATARALHLAALSDDAAEFGRVVETAAKLWRDGRLSGVSAGQLRTLVESEFWVMDAAARASGAGFVVKQLIASLPAELAERAGATAPPAAD